MYPTKEVNYCKSLLSFSTGKMKILPSPSSSPSSSSPGENITNTFAHMRACWFSGSKLTFHKYFSFFG